MPRIRLSKLAVLSFFLFSTLSVLAAVGQDAAEEKPAEVDPIHPDRLLVTGAVDLHLPAFGDDDLAGVRIADLLEGLPHVPGEDPPAANREFSGPDATAKKWASKSARNGSLALDRPKDQAAVRWLAFYLTTDRWVKVSLNVSGEHPVIGSLDGADLSLTKKDGDDSEPTRHEGDLKLAIGKHLIVLRTLADPEVEGDWKLGVSVTADDEAKLAALEFSVDPKRPADIRTILDAPRIASASLSPDGTLAALRLGEYRNGKDREQWLEIRDTRDGRLVRLWRGSQAPGRVAWHPQGRTLTWQTDHEDKATVHVFDLDDGRDRRRAGRRGAPGPLGLGAGRPLAAVRDQPRTRGRRAQGQAGAHPADRQPWWRDRSHLMQVFVPGGVTRRLTAGPVSPDGWELSARRQQPALLPERTGPHHAALQHQRAVAAGPGPPWRPSTILADPWIGGATWSPDGKTLCLQGSPSAFDGLGRNLPDGRAGQRLRRPAVPVRPGQGAARRGRDPRPCTPDVSGVDWSPADGHIYAEATDTQYDERLPARSPDAGTGSRSTTGLEVTDQLALARDAAAGRGARHQRHDPQPAHRRGPEARTARGCCWTRAPTPTGTSSSARSRTGWPPCPTGMTLDGFVYYPPDFDPARKYPVIVYYYGGTSPITRDFGGRYPKNIWAGQGYVVYVPNPSGATGYGQEFAARHVNDWGQPDRRRGDRGHPRLPGRAPVRRPDSAWAASAPPTAAS